MFAVIKSGGKQYKVSKGDKLALEKLSGNAGDKIELSDVLMVGEGASLKLAGEAAKTKVTAEILEQGKADKIIVFKKKRRQNYRRKNGHRQLQTVVRITEISA